MSSGKQYGLNIPKKNLLGMVQKHAAFGDDSDSDKSDGGGTDWTKRALKATEKTTVKRQTKIDMHRALEQDSTVYQYDEVYDQMEKSKQDKHQKEKERKPKYIQKLLVSAEKRKIENERRTERQVQKEREEEGDEFKDKETFVTSAYKKKLEEFAKLDAEQKRLDMLEEIGDVTKQQDIGGFYRHLYQQTLSDPKEDSLSKNSTANSVSPKKENSQPHSSRSAGSKQEDTSSKVDKCNDSSRKSEAKKDRHYRKRKGSESSVEDNKDADTDGESSSSSSSSSDSESEKSSPSETEDPKRIRSKDYTAEEKVAPEETAVPENVVVLQPVEPERSIWEKRTVGPVFDAALKRYLERKSVKLTSVF